MNHMGVDITLKRFYYCPWVERRAQQACVHNRGVQGTSQRLARTDSWPCYLTTWNAVVSGTHSLALLTWTIWSPDLKDFTIV